MSQATELISKQMAAGSANARVWADILYNVKLYGAKGDWNGTTGTDDTVSVQATIDAAIAAGGKAVFFPHGTYKVTALTNVSSVILFGDNAVFSGINNTITQIGAPVTSGIFYNVKDYGAKGDGINDDTASIQATLDKVNPNGGKVTFPAGTYKITSPLRIYGNNVSVEGAGIGAAIIMNYGNGNAISLTDTWQKLQITITDLTIDASTPSNGCGIELTNVNRSVIQNVQVKNHMNLIKFGDSCFDVWCSKLNLVNVKQNGVALLMQLGINGGGIYVNQTTIDCGYDGTIAHDGTDGIHIESGSGCFFTDIDIRRAGRDGVIIVPLANTQVTYMWFTNVLGDTSKAIGVHIQCPAGGKVYGIEFNGCWAGTNTAQGLVIEGAGDIDGVDVVNLRSYDNGLSGIYLASGKNINVAGGTISGNSKTTPNNTAGVLVDAGVSEFGFDSVRVGPASGRAATQSIGIQIVAGASDNYKITDCDVRGNAFAGIDDNGTGTNKIIRDNLGYKTESGGTFTANGTGAQTVFNIPHGLAKAPSIYNVTAGSSAANTAYYVTADATNIIVTYTTAPVTGTGNVILRWNAKV